MKLKFHEQDISERMFCLLKPNSMLGHKRVKRVKKRHIKLNSLQGWNTVSISLPVWPTIAINVKLICYYRMSTDLAQLCKLQAVCQFFIRHSLPYNDFRILHSNVEETQPCQAIRLSRHSFEVKTTLFMVWDCMYIALGL